MAVSVSDVVTLALAIKGACEAVPHAESLLASISRQMDHLLPVVQSLDAADVGPLFLSDLREQMRVTLDVAEKARRMNRLVLVVRASDLREKVETSLKAIQLSLATLQVTQNRALHTQNRVLQERLGAFQKSWESWQDEFREGAERERRERERLASGGREAAVSLMSARDLGGGGRRAGLAEIEEAVRELRLERDREMERVLAEVDSVARDKLNAEAAFMEQIISSLEAAEEADAAGASTGQRRDLEKLPDACFCPLSKELMLDPVVVDAPCSHTCSREAFLDWLNRGKTNCPICRVELRTRGMMPNVTTREIIESYLGLGLSAHTSATAAGPHNANQGGMAGTDAAGVVTGSATPTEGLESGHAASATQHTRPSAQSTSGPASHTSKPAPVPQQEGNGIDVQNGLFNSTGSQGQGQGQGQGSCTSWMSRKSAAILAALILVLVGVGVGVGIAMGGGKGSGSDPADQGKVDGGGLTSDSPTAPTGPAAPSSPWTTPASPPADQPVPTTTTGTTRPNTEQPTESAMESLKQRICTSLPSTCTDLSTEGTPQWEALEWLAGHPEFVEMEEWRRVQLYALATIAFSLYGWGFNGISDWRDNGDDECSWVWGPSEDYDEILCDSSGRVTHIGFHNDLFAAKKGVPRDVALLSDSLEVLDFTWGDFGGTIPTELGMLTRLERLDLDGNKLTGSVPSELGRLSKLEMLYLGRNDLSGEMPEEVCNLRTPAGQLDVLGADCEEVQCDCCNACCVDGGGCTFF